jgi:hypothetical protein
LVDGLRPTYAWISGQVLRNARDKGEALQVSAAVSKPKTYERGPMVAGERVRAARQDAMQ